MASRARGLWLVVAEPRRVGSHCLLRVPSARTQTSLRGPFGQAGLPGERGARRRRVLTPSGRRVLTPSLVQSRVGGCSALRSEHLGVQRREEGLRQCLPPRAGQVAQTYS